MCGIGGMVNWDGRTPDREDIAALVNAQHHRGPDGQGIWTGDGAALAHNRLAIIDLETGQQPMVWRDRFVLTYNGELYNFRELRAELEASGARFRTSSDTEVVLAAYERWGRSSVERLRGMYAFAIWDRLDRTLFVARDRVGIKPLYYCRTPAFFAFASELQGLLSLPGVERRMDIGALDLYLHYQYVAPPLTIYEGILKLEPAHSLLLNASDPVAASQPYWNVRFDPDRSLGEDEWLERIDAEISDAVRCHLVSDVPFGAFLSGGIDSSIVAYHMSRHLAQPIRTFTIGFDEAAYDERQQAGIVAAAVGARHRCEVVHVDKYDLLDDLIFRLARHYGEPFADSSAIPTYCVSAVARSEVKMVLSGDGGDELFAGYNTYPNILRAAAPPRRWFDRWRTTPGGDGLMARALAAPGAATLAEYDRYYAYFGNDLRRGLYRPEVAELVAAHDRHAMYRDTFERSGSRDSLSALQYLDIKTYLPGDILTKVDVAAMYSSLEVRVPLLDHRVIETAARVPPEMRLFAPDGTLQQKYLLKKYVNRLLPGDAFTRPKQGFGVPIGDWFGGELYPRVCARLTGSPVISSLLNPEAVGALVQTREAAQANAPRVWALLFLDAWFQAYAPALPVVRS